jgi:hypothetical protein
MKENGNGQNDLCKFDGTHSHDQLCEWAERIIEHKICNHVGRTDLARGVGTLFAIFDVPCFASENGSARCIRPSAEKLLLLAKNGLSPRKGTLKMLVTVEAIPSSSLQLEGATKDSRNSNKLELDWVVLPFYPTLKPWSNSIGVAITKGKEFVSASIDVVVNSRAANPRGTQTTVNLAIVIPAEIGGTMVPDLANMILAESIKALIPDGWKFLKEKVARIGEGDSDLITLDLGDIRISSSTLSSDGILPLVQKSDLTAVLGDVRIMELDGLNNRLGQVANQRRHLQGLVKRAGTTIDESRSLAEIDQLTKDIDQLQPQIWDLLVSTDRVCVLPSPDAK